MPFSFVCISFLLLALEDHFSSLTALLLFLFIRLQGQIKDVFVDGTVMVHYKGTEHYFVFMFNSMYLLRFTAHIFQDLQPNTMKCCHTIILGNDPYLLIMS